MPPSETPRTASRTWFRAILILSDGRRLDLRLPGVIAGSVARYTPDAHEHPSITVIKNGQHRRGQLGPLLGDR